LDFNTAVDNFENALIMQALERTGWNRNKAAGLLNLNRTTLVEKIKKKGLTPHGAA
jgi:DNA-binding NtrC family response regulator